jgi:hypothetical protein
MRRFAIGCEKGYVGISQIVGEPSNPDFKPIEFEGFRNQAVELKISFWFI